MLDRKIAGKVGIVSFTSVVHARSDHASHKLHKPKPCGNTCLSQPWPMYVCFLPMQLRSCHPFTMTIAMRMGSYILPTAEKIRLEAYKSH